VLKIIDPFGINHPEVKAFIQKEDNDCKRWNNYIKRVNENMNAGLKYKINRYLEKYHLTS
jgi:hypothetical protein